MKGDWQVVPRDAVPAFTAGIHVTMNPKGHIMMNRTTFQRTGEPKAYLVLFDRVNSRIGLKPTHEKAKDAYPVGPLGPCGGRVVRAYRLITQYAIDLPETVEFTAAEIDQDGMLILDLRMTRISPRAVANRKRRRLGVSGGKAK